MVNAVHGTPRVGGYSIAERPTIASPSRAIQKRSARVPHLLAALLGTREEARAMCGEVELPYLGAPHFAVAPALEHLDVVRDVRSHSRHTDLAALCTHPGLPCIDELFVVRFAPDLWMEQETHRAEPLGSFSPGHVPPVQECDRDPIALRHHPREHLARRWERPPEMEHLRIARLIGGPRRLEVGDLLTVGNGRGAQFESGLGFGHRRQTSLALSIRLISAPCLGARCRTYRGEDAQRDRLCASRSRRHRGA